MKNSSTCIEQSAAGCLKWHQMAFLQYLQSRDGPDTFLGKCPMIVLPFSTSTAYQSMAFRGSHLHARISPRLLSRSLYICSSRKHSKLFQQYCLSCLLDVFRSGTGRLVGADQSPPISHADNQLPANQSREQVRHRDAKRVPIRRRSIARSQSFGLVPIRRWNIVT